MKYIKHIAELLINNIQCHIKYKLFIVLFTFVSIPVILLGSISYSMSSAAVEKDYIKSKLQMNNQIINNINNNISNLEKLSMSTYLILDDMNFMLNTSIKNINSKYFDVSSKLDNYFLGLLQTNDTVNGIALINKNGEVKTSVDRQFSPTISFSIQDTEWFKQVVALGGSPLLMEPHYNEFYDKSAIRKREKVISIARLVKLQYESIEQASGVLIVDEETDTFFKDVINVETDPGEIIIVYGSSGNVLYTNTAPSSIDFPLINTLVLNNYNKNSLQLKFGKTSMLVSFGDPTKYGLRVVSLLPVSELQKKSSFIKHINFTLLLLLSLFMLIVSILASYFLTKRLKVLNAAFKCLQSGDFNTSIPVNGKDELSQIGLSFNHVVSNIKNLVRQKYESNILRKQAELESLQSQINPHFFFNTLSSIKASIEESDIEKSTKMIYDLSDIFRYSLNRGKYEVTFFEELEHVKKYLSIQCDRFPGRFEITYDIDNEVLNFTTLRLTLQPIVENAIYHGLESVRYNGRLTITAKQFLESYYIYISDNGIGIAEDELEGINHQLNMDPDSPRNCSRDKIGIYNVNSRIKLHYGKEFGLKLYSNYRKGTTVRIVLPAKNMAVVKNGGS